MVDRSVNNGILGNSIFSNAGIPGANPLVDPPLSYGLGIDLVSAGEGAGVTINGSLGHSGGNNYQNYPVLSSAIGTGGSTTVTGTFHSTPSTNNFRLEFFSNTSCNQPPSGYLPASTYGPWDYGEGQTFLGYATVNTDASGNATVNFVISGEITHGWSITATATDPANNTSEFSQCRVVTGPPDTDNDGIPDASDNCPTVYNPDQLNSDGGKRPAGPQIPGGWASNPAADKLGDACDPDDDNDGLPDASENELSCPYRLNADSDGDRIVDGYEVSHSTNACDAGSPATPACSGVPFVDSDSDGLSDCIEHSGYNTCASVNDPVPGWSSCANPMDSDGDGCADVLEVMDINGDRKVSVGDQTLLAKRGAGLFPPSSSDSVFDVNKDGKISVGDQTLMAKNICFLKPWLIGCESASCPAE